MGLAGQGQTPPTAATTVAIKYIIVKNLSYLVDGINIMEQSSNTDTGWNQDALGRKPLAQHLTRSLVGLSNHYATTLGRGVTVSLDGDWGSGKTFFVKRWSEDLRSEKYPTIYFDAWKNDIGDEASVALMSAILAGLDEWRSKLPMTATIQQQASDLKKKSIETLRKAILPASKIVAKGLIKKLSGVAVGELMDALDSSNSGANDGVKSTNVVLDDTLDDLFQKTLEDHQSRQKSLEHFRDSLSKLLLLIKEHTEAEFPLFIFVDELDRCRPSYAVKLLEEIKHIFGIENVCYVISTNISQLQESIKALYGASFDGQRYLKRLFDREYHLPTPDTEKHARSLISDKSILRSRHLIFGLPPTLEGGSKTREYVLGLIFYAYNFDLRSQKQVFNLIEDVATALPSDRPIHFIYLAYLCSLNFKNGDFLDKLISHNTINSKPYDFKSTLAKDTLITYKARSANITRHEFQTKTVNLSEILNKYYIWSKLNYTDLREAYNKMNNYDYPDLILNELVSELSGKVIDNASYPLAISTYPTLVRHAGFLAPE